MSETKEERAHITMQTQRREVIERPLLSACREMLGGVLSMSVVFYAQNALCGLLP